jgi:hypothetical protein
MDINIRLKIDAPTGWQRRVLLYVVTPLALVAATAAIAHATIDTSWIADGKPVSSSKLEGNLKALDMRLATLEHGEPTYGAQVTAGGGVVSMTGGSWLAPGGSTGIAGNYVYNFPAATFTATPACVATGVDNGANTSITIFIQGLSSTQLKLQAIFNGQPTAISLTLICTGK